MVEIQRYSPVFFGDHSPVRTEFRDNWRVVLEYDNESNGDCWIIDLSHTTRLDVQSAELSGITPFGISIPEMPGTSVIKDGILINRMNPTQASVFHIEGDLSKLSTDTSYTDVTEAALCLAIIGQPVFSITEKLSSLDFADSARTVPFLLQGPFSHVPCQIVILKRDGDHPGILFTCSRGYGRSMVHAVMDAGDEFGLRAAGEERFLSWFKTL